MVDFVRGTWSVRIEFGRCSRNCARLSSEGPPAFPWGTTRILLCKLLLQITISVCVFLALGCSRGPTEPDPTPVENRRDGARDVALSNPATSGEIEGYAPASTVRPAERLSLHVSTPSRGFDVRIYRLGWYGGAGARLMLEKEGIPGGLRARPVPRSEDGLVACDWPA